MPSQVECWGRCWIPRHDSSHGKNRMLSLNTYEDALLIVQMEVHHKSQSHLNRLLDWQVRDGARHNKFPVFFSGNSRGTTSNPRTRGGTSDTAMAIARCFIDLVVSG